MKRFMSIALCFVLAVTVFIMPVSATTAASVVYLVNGNTFATVENLSAGFSYAPDRMAENIPDGKYFAGWQNENGYYTVDLPENMTGGAAGHPNIEQDHIMSDVLYEFFVEKDLV